jgi:hypothetical protein
MKNYEEMDNLCPNVHANDFEHCLYFVKNDI